MTVHWRSCGVTALLVAAIGCAHQIPAPVTQARPMGTTFVIDTGRMAPGHIEFSRYDTPGKCRDAVATTRDALWRREDRDTLPYSPEKDTLPTEAVTIGRTCATRFTPQETEPRELRNLVELFLMLGADDLANTTVNRRLELSGGVTEQGEVLYETLQSYMEAQPMRRDAAVATLSKLDALGRPVLGLRIAGHALIAQDALRRFDQKQMRDEAETIIADSQNLTAKERDDWMPAIRDAYIGLISLTWYEKPSDIPNLYARAQADLGPLRNGTGGLGFFGYPLFRVNAVLTQVLAMLGEPAPRLQAQYWFGAGPDTVRPRLGKVSVLVRVDKDCGQSCYPLYAALKRLNAKYAGQGLEITLMTRTVGYSSGSAPQTPAAEAAAAQKYFFDFVKLPFTLAVAKTPFTRRADGQRIDGKAQFERAYMGNNMVIADRDGRLVMLSDETSEGVLDAYIKRALGATNK